MQAVLKAQINKTDRNDARGIAQMIRAGLYRPVHVKTLRSQKLRMLLTHRKVLQSKAIAIENDLIPILKLNDRCRPTPGAVAGLCAETSSSGPFWYASLRRQKSRSKLEQGRLIARVLGTGGDCRSCSALLPLTSFGSGIL
jgi:hypothetical protein